MSHTTYVVCFNFIPKWRDLQCKVESEQQVFKKLLMARTTDFLLSEFLPELCREEIAGGILFTSARTLALRIIRQHTTY